MLYPTPFTALRDVRRDDRGGPTLLVNRSPPLDSERMDLASPRLMEVLGQCGGGLRLSPPELHFVCQEHDK
ncbi:hypothetical protein EYF80_014607 [Liparis tanakae]|uniref:Uncharacterized protein n=1 Tax=Liparis tanakae TaxID=230148 RepID=A0A4Z2IB57_9TELE|nr:hypothetical protein EYF80_014607 [Liparis tanakae]